MNTILFWLNNARKVAVLQSFFPAVLAVCMSAAAFWDDFSFLLSALAVLGVVFTHLAANLLDDFFDYKYRPEIQNQNIVSQSPIRAGKCGYLISGAANVRSLFVAFTVFFALGLICGSVILWQRGIVILYFILITGFLSVSYSGLLRLSYHGLGELLIGFIFGPLLMAGVYYSACGHFSSSLWIVSAAVGIWVSNILFVHSVMDYEADKAMEKKTLAVILKNQNAMLLVAFLFHFLPFIVILYGIEKQYLSAFYYFILGVLPLAVASFYLLVEYVKHPEKKYVPRFWMGPMEHWHEIKQAHLDDFMLRWYLARNTTAMFCFILLIVCFL